MSTKINKLVTFIVLFTIVVMISCTSKKTDDATPNVSLSKDLFPIFRVSCAVEPTCHSGPYSGNHIDLTDSLAYTSIIAKGLVYPSTPTASVLYKEIVTGRMPKDPYPKLTAAQIKLVLNWIQQGAKDN